MRHGRSSRVAQGRRRGFRGILLAGALLSFGTASATPVTNPGSPTPPVIRPDVTRDSPQMRIVAFGSSSTEGVGASTPAASYPARLERLFADALRDRIVVKVVNRGVGGEAIDAMLRRLGTDILSRKPDLVIWQVGSNDALRGISSELFERELREGVAAIRASGSEVVLMEPQWSPKIDKIDAASRFVEAVREVGAQEHVDVIRRFALMHRWMQEGRATEAELIGPDGLHMTDKGYDLLARAVFDELSAHSARLRDRVSVAASKHP